MALLKANGSIVMAVRDVEGRFILHETRTVIRQVKAKIAQNDPRLITDVDRMQKLKHKLELLRISSSK